MKIAYDISVLGRGHYFPDCRTGVFRVVESLGEELVKQGVIQQFTLGNDLASYFRCRDYLSSNERLKTVKITQPAMSRLSLGIDRALFNTCHQKCASTASRANRFYTHNCRLAFERVNADVNADTIMNVNSWNGVDIHHSLFDPILPCLKQHKHIKKFLTVYDLIPALFPDYFDAHLTDLMNQILHSIDDDSWVTCVSQSTKNDLCAYLPSLDPEKVFVIHSAASDAFYQCTDTSLIESVKVKYGIPEGPYILSLSTLEPRKNIARTIRSFLSLIESGQMQDLSLVLVGATGWDYDGIIEEVRVGQQAKRRIIMTGYIPDEELAPMYSGAMMFVYPSLYEGFGLPPLEAMQCGVPVITSNRSSLPEVVGNAGIMVDPEDMEALCQAMLTIHRSEETRAEMRANSLQQARKFSWQRCAEQTVEAYQVAMDS